jgi:hypothetical protein
LLSVSYGPKIYSDRNLETCWRKETECVGIWNDIIQDILKILSGSDPSAGRNFQTDTLEISRLLKIRILQISKILVFYPLNWQIRIFTFYNHSRYPCILHPYKQYTLHIPHTSFQTYKIHIWQSWNHQKARQASYNPDTQSSWYYYLDSNN